MKLTKNMGLLDRIIRTVLAGIAVALYCTGTVSGVLGIILVVLGIVLALTAAFSTCPLYIPFKISTTGK